MAQTWCVLIVLAFLSLASATRLSCICDVEVCKQWEGNKNASQGNLNGLKFCCPPEPDQGLQLRFSPDGNTCFCKAGTTEKYGHLVKPCVRNGDSSGSASGSAGGSAGDNAANHVGPHYLTFVALLIVGLFLFLL